MPELIQFTLSLLAIFALAGMAYWLGLGGDVRIRDEAHACELADEVISGFDAVEVTLDRGRIGAILRDSAGRVMVIRRHGAHFAGRVLDCHVHSRLDQHRLTLATGDRQFGSITLDLGTAAPIWSASLRRLEGRG